MQQYQQIIEEAWENRASLQPGTAPAKVGEAVGFILNELDEGRLRVAEKISGEWVTHQWLKKAVLLSFRLEDNRPMDSGALRFFDKVPTKFANYDAEKFARGGFRLVAVTLQERFQHVQMGCVIIDDQNLSFHGHASLVLGKGNSVVTVVPIPSLLRIRTAPP